MARVPKHMQPPRDAREFACPECGVDVLFYPHDAECRAIVQRPYVEALNRAVREANQDREREVQREMVKDGRERLECETSKPTNPKDIIGSDKLPLHLFPTTAIAYGSVAMLEGLLKYGRSNYRAIGVKASIYKDALDRHMNAWFEGEDIDPDSGLPHLAKALACIAILIEATTIGNMTDDRNYPGGYHKVVREMTPHVKRLKKQHQKEGVRHYTFADVKVREGEDA